jgi:Ca2+-binding RTX toxin-like protein
MRPRVRLWMESLDSRAVPAVDIPDFAPGTGTPGDDTIVVRDQPGHPDRYEVVVNGRVAVTGRWADQPFLSVNAGAGDDMVTVEAVGGRVFVTGGTGNDYLQGSAGSDTLEGYTGDDTLCGGGGDDYLLGDEGNDRIEGGAGNDYLEGSAGDDTLQGADGNDVLDGGGGIWAAVLVPDPETGEMAHPWEVVPDGNDRVDGGSGDDVLRGGTDADCLSGGTGNDRVDGQRGDDRVIGGFGDDTLVGGRGRDAFFGGPGEDWADWVSGTDVGSRPHGIEHINPEPVRPVVVTPINPWPLRKVGPAAALQQVTPSESLGPAADAGRVFTSFRLISDVIADKR